MSQSERRASRKSRSSSSTRQKRVERVLKVSSASPAAPYAILMRSPVLLERYLGMTDYLRFETRRPSTSTSSRS